MTKAKFNTKNAEYVARGGSHLLTPFSRREVEKVFDEYGGGVDAIVMELPGSKVLKTGEHRGCSRKGGES